MRPKTDRLDGRQPHLQLPASRRRHCPRRRGNLRTNGTTRCSPPRLPRRGRGGCEERRWLTERRGDGARRAPRRGVWRRRARARRGARPRLAGVEQSGGAAAVSPPPPPPPPAAGHRRRHAGVQAVPPRYADRRRRGRLDPTAARGFRLPGIGGAEPLPAVVVAGAHARPSRGPVVARAMNSAPSCGRARALRYEDVAPPLPQLRRVRVQRVLRDLVQLRGATPRGPAKAKAKAPRVCRLHDAAVAFRRALSGEATQRSGSSETAPTTSTSTARLPAPRLLPVHPRRQLVATLQWLAEGNEVPHGRPRRAIGGKPPKPVLRVAIEHARSTPPRLTPARAPVAMPADLLRARRRPPRVGARPRRRQRQTATMTLDAGATRRPPPPPRRRRWEKSSSRRPIRRTPSAWCVGWPPRVRLRSANVAVRQCSARW